MDERFGRRDWCTDTKGIEISNNNISVQQNDMLTKTSTSSYFSDFVCLQLNFIFLNY